MSRIDDIKKKLEEAAESKAPTKTPVQPQGDSVQQRKEQYKTAQQPTAVPKSPVTVEGPGVSDRKDQLKTTQEPTALPKTPVVVDGPGVKDRKEQLKTTQEPTAIAKTPVVVEGAPVSERKKAFQSWYTQILGARQQTGASALNNAPPPPKGEPPQGVKGGLPPISPTKPPPVAKDPPPIPQGSPPPGSKGEPPPIPPGNLPPLSKDGPPARKEGPPPPPQQKTPQMPKDGPPSTKPKVVTTAPKLIRWVCTGIQSEPHEEKEAEAPAAAVGPVCPTCGEPMRRKVSRAAIDSAEQAGDESQARQHSPEKLKKLKAGKAARQATELKEALGKEPFNLAAVNKALDALFETASDVQHKVSNAGVELNSVMTEMEKTCGGVVMGIFTDPAVPIEVKAALHRRSAENGNLLHNLAVGHLESLAPKDRDPEEEKQYTQCLRDMATAHLSANTAKLCGPKADPEKVKRNTDYLQNNTALGRIFVQGDAMDPEAALHPGYWGLFVMPPSSAEQLKKTREGEGAFSHDLPYDPGAHFYNTIGNNRRAFQRVVKEDGSFVTFSTKGGGMDLAVDASKVYTSFREDIAKLNERMEHDPGKLHCFDIREGDAGHSTVGFGDYSMARLDFVNMRDKYARMDKMVENAPTAESKTAFQSVQAAMVKPLFCTAMAKTPANLDRLPDKVRRHCDGVGGEMPTQLVTSGPAETSLRLHRVGTGKEDMYRLRTDVKFDKPVFLLEGLTRKNGDYVRKGEALFTYAELTKEEEALLTTSLAKQEEQNSLERDKLPKAREQLRQAEQGEKERTAALEAKRQELSELEKQEDSEGENAGDIIRLKSDIQRREASATRQRKQDEALIKQRTEELAKLETGLEEVKKVLGDLGPKAEKLRTELKTRAKIKIADNDVRINEAPVRESNVLPPGDALFDAIESSVEHKEFMEVVKQQQKISAVPIERDKLCAVKGGKALQEDEKERVEAAYLITHNLLGSLALFAEDGDTSANIANSFEARNVSNGTIRDEDGWGDGLVRFLQDKSKPLTWAARDLQDCQGSLQAVLKTMDVPPNAQMTEDMKAVEGALGTVLANMYGVTEAKNDAIIFGSSPSVGARFADPEKALTEAKPGPDQEFWKIIKEQGITFPNLTVVETKLKGSNFPALCGQFSPAMLDGLGLDAAKVGRQLQEAGLLQDAKTLSSTFIVADRSAAVQALLGAALTDEEAGKVVDALATRSGQDADFVRAWPLAKKELHVNTKKILKHFLPTQMPESLKGLGALFAGLSET